MKNYYEILEVSENASKEVIDKAYRTLAKKYHPDMQPKENKKIYEEAMKEITEAYNILSNPILKQKYDFQLHGQDNINEVSIEEEKSRVNILNRYSDNAFTNLAKSSFSTIKDTIYNETKKDPKERARDFKALGLTIIIIGLLIFIGWKVPFIHNYFAP